MIKNLITTVLAALIVLSAAGAQAQSAKPMPMMHTRTMPRMVAYDAKDNKYYSVAYAKAHGMHDRGGDLLTIVPSKSLPKTATMSHAMRGHL